MIGQTISHYEILEKLGEGGMGVVYKARDTSLDRFVALKFLPSQFTQDKERRERFISEAKAASALDHPNICTIYEINETKPAPGEPGDGQLYICMAYYEGQTLKEKIKDQGLKIKDAVSYSIQIAQGLLRAYEEGIIHRDIKPANIMITGREEVKILDFGLAKLAGAELTESISTKGTIAYMSPEIIRGLPVDQRSDIWSLGVVLYEMLTGQLPFKGDYAEPMMYAILNEAPESVGNYREDISGLLESIIKRILKKDPKERYQNITGLLKDLNASEIGSQKKSEIKRERKPKWIECLFRWRYKIAGIIIIILILGLFGYRSFFKSDDAAYYPFTAKEWARIEEDRNREFVIAILPFWGMNDEAMQEGRVMQALISRQLYDELGQEPRIRIISPNLMILPRSQEMVNELNKDNPANLYIWGEVYILHDEVEIQPYLTVTEDLTSLWYSNIPHDFPALEASITDVSKLTFRRAKAAEISDIILSITGHYYIHKRNFEKALLILNRIQPPSSQSLALQGDIQFLKGERNVADSLYQLAVILDPHDPFHYLRLANVYCEIILFQKALQSIRKCLSIDSNMVVTYVMLGEIYNAMKKREEMWKALERGLQLDTNDIPLNLSFAYMHWEDSNYEQTIHYIKKAIQIDPAKPLSYLSLAWIYNRLGQYDKAIKLAHKMVKLNPMEANAYRILGNTYKGLGNYKASERQYLKAIKLHESNEFNYHALAFLYMFQENFQAAILLWEKTIELTPNSPYWRVWLARTYILEGDFMKAESVLQDFIEQVPSSESAILHIIYSNLGIIHYLNGQFETAMEYFLKRLNLSNLYGFGHVTAHCYFLHHQLGIRTEAITILKNALTQLNPKNKKEIWQRYLLLFLLGDISESELFQLADDRVPQRRLMHLTEAYYYVGKKYLLKNTGSDDQNSEYREKAYDMFKKCVNMKNNPLVFQATEIMLAKMELALLEKASR